MAAARDMDVPGRAPCFLVELAFHDSRNLGQPRVAGVFGAEHQRDADAVLVGAAKTLAPAVEADARSFRRLDEAAWVHGAEVEPGRNRLPLPNQRIDAVSGPQRSADRSSNPLALHGTITTSDVRPFMALDRDDGIRFRPVLQDRLEERLETVHRLYSRLRQAGDEGEQNHR